MRKITPYAEGMYAIEILAESTFVRMKENSKKTYIVKGYDRHVRAYEISDYNDISSNRYLKKGKMVFAGFDY